VFWSLMADIFSSDQAKRLFGFIAAGGTVGTIAPRPFTLLFVNARSAPTRMLLISAAGFVITALLGALDGGEKRKLVAVSESEAHRTSLDHSSAAIPFDGFVLLFRRAIC
jgi:ATP:ADP antiporter, AAA family